MRAAPAVVVSLGRSTAWRGIQAALWAAAAGALAAWWVARGGASAAWGLSAALPVGLLAWWALPLQDAQLAWTGQQWLLDGQAATVTVALDLDRWLLLRLGGLAARPRVRWLPATAAQAGAHWHGLRAALYSRAPEATPAAAHREGGPAPD